MARNRKRRRQQQGSAWHGKQTDAWYDSEPGTMKRMPSFDEQCERIRGRENKEAARIALTRITVAAGVGAESSERSPQNLYVLEFEESNPATSPGPA